MRLIFTEDAWADYQYWVARDPAKLARVNQLIADTQRHPFEGLGKPEALKHALSGYWSRRIDGEHRFVYRVEGDALLIVQLRYHYR